MVVRGSPEYKKRKETPSGSLVQNRKENLEVARSLMCGVNEIKQENKLEIKADHKGDYLKR